MFIDLLIFFLFIIIFHRGLFDLGLGLHLTQLEEVHVELDETLREQDLLSAV